MPEVFIRDLGRADFKSAWDYQQLLFDFIIAGKLRRREDPTSPQTPGFFLFCEHPHVYTLGKSGDESHLLAGENELRESGATFFRINRGGDITYHGPGQIVGYPILDLDNYFTDVHKYLRYLEEGIIRTLAEYGITADRYPGYTGVWIDAEHPQRARKIAAMGVKMSRWVTMHGFALNVNTDLSMFSQIIPCGIQGKQVTSIALELERTVSEGEVKQKLLKHYADLFDIQWNEVWPKELEPVLC